jgi:hypothetical protein
MTTYLEVTAVGEEAALGEAAVRRRFVGAMEWNGIRIRLARLSTDQDRKRSSLWSCEMNAKYL